MITIGLGEYAITDTENEKLITHALGSCVALVLYCPESKCTSMAHIVLPERDKGHDMIVNKEAYYAKDIVHKLVDFYLQRPKCYKRSLKAYIIGGSESKNKSDVFMVGPRNVEMVENLLKAKHIPYDKTDTLGNVSRTVEIDVNSGSIQIRKRNMII